MIVKEPQEEEVKEDSPGLQAKLKVALEKYRNEDHESDEPKWKVAIKKLLDVKKESVEPDRSSRLESVAVENNEGNNDDKEESD